MAVMPSPLARQEMLELVESSVTSRPNLNLLPIPNYLVSLTRVVAEPYLFFISCC